MRGEDLFNSGRFDEALAVYLGCLETLRAIATSRRELTRVASLLQDIGDCYDRMVGVCSCPPSRI